MTYQFEHEWYLCWCTGLDQIGEIGVNQVSQHCYKSLLPVAVASHCYQSLLQVTVHSHCYKSLYTVTVTCHCYTSLLHVTVTCHCSRHCYTSLLHVTVQHSPHRPANVQHRSRSACCGLVGCDSGAKRRINNPSLNQNERHRSAAYITTTKYTSNPPSPPTFQTDPGKTSSTAVVLTHTHTCSTRRSPQQTHTANSKSPGNPQVSSFRHTGPQHTA